MSHDRAERADVGSGSTDAPDGSVGTDPDGPALLIATILRAEGTTGVHTHMGELSRYLHGRGIAPAQVTPFSWCKPLATPVFGFRIALGRVNRAAAVAWYFHWHEVFLRRALRRRLAGEGRAIVYAQGPQAARAALRARRDASQRVVMAVHFTGDSQAVEWILRGHIKSGGVVDRTMRHLERGVVPQLDGIMYVSRSKRADIEQSVPEARAVPSAVIPNFVAPLDAPLAAPATSSPATGGPQRDLVSVGGLEVFKNHRFLLDVLAVAKRAGRSFTLDVFGEGPCRHDLLRQARALGLADQVRFPGYRADVRSLLPGYRAYVHSSYAESFTLAIIEAMAAGLPVVAAAVGGIPDLCEDGVEGRFWPLDDPDRAAAILIQLLDSEPDRIAAGAASLARFRREFDAAIVGPRLWSFLVGAGDADDRGVHEAAVADTAVGTFG